jgi:hypothetical protein
VPLAGAPGRGVGADLGPAVGGALGAVEGALGPPAALGRGVVIFLVVILKILLIY